MGLSLAFGSSWNRQQMISSFSWNWLFWASLSEGGAAHSPGDPGLIRGSGFSITIYRVTTSLISISKFPLWDNFWCFPPFIYVQNCPNPSCLGNDWGVVEPRVHWCLFPFGRSFGNCFSASSHCTCIMGIVFPQNSLFFFPWVSRFSSGPGWGCNPHRWPLCRRLVWALTNRN